MPFQLIGFKDKKIRLFESLWKGSGLRIGFNVQIEKLSSFPENSNESQLFKQNFCWR